MVSWSGLALTAGVALVSANPVMMSVGMSLLGAVAKKLARKTVNSLIVYTHSSTPLIGAPDELLPFPNL